MAHHLHHPVADEVMRDLRRVRYFGFWSWIFFIGLVEVADELVQVRLVCRDCMRGVPFFEFNILYKTLCKHKNYLYTRIVNVQIVFYIMSKKS